MSDQQHRRSWSIPEFARRHNLSRSLVYSQLNNGNLRSLKIGKARRITDQHEAEWLKNCERKAEGQG